MGYDMLGDILLKALAKGELLRDEPMSSHTTFGVGGPADWLAMPHDVQGIAAVLDAAKRSNAPCHVLGLGSNVLVADAGVRGVVCSLAQNMRGVEVSGARIKAMAGASNKLVAEVALEAGLTGFEFACGIPGSVGGGAYMNAGAYGGQFSDIVSECTCLTPAGDIVRIAGEDAGFGYRASLMMRESYVVLDVTFDLECADAESIRAKMDDLTARREQKQPLDLGSAGSTFKRPQGHYAAALIEEAGLKGYTVGGAQVSAKHAGFVVNAGGATAADVMAVIEHTKVEVLRASGVELELEVRLWGF